MKKVFAVLALVAVMTSCKDKKKTDAPVTTGDTTTTTATTTEPATTSTDVPKFSDAEVQKYVEDYTAFVNSYVEAYKSKDMTKVADLSGKASDWSSRSIDVSKKLAANPDEAMKFSNYITALSKRWTDAMQIK